MVARSVMSSGALFELICNDYDIQSIIISYMDAGQSLTLAVAVERGANGRFVYPTTQDFLRSWNESYDELPGCAHTILICLPSIAGAPISASWCRVCGFFCSSFLLTFWWRLLLRCRVVPHVCSRVRLPILIFLVVQLSSQQCSRALQVQSLWRLWWAHHFQVMSLLGM